MAINLTTADSALKTYYLDAITEQLNFNVNPFLAQIKQSTKDVYGKEVKKLITYGINGGIGAGTEDGALPKSGNNNYQYMVSTLKNLYGTIEISDKAIRASENNTGAFVNLLEAEMEGLIKASSFNFSRMLFGDGSGVLCKIATIENGVVMTMDTTKNLRVGMIVDLRYPGGSIVEGLEGRKIIAIRSDNHFVVDANVTCGNIIEGGKVTIQNSLNNEITGLERIFSNDYVDIYGVNKVDNPWITPYRMDSVGDVTEIKIQSAIDEIEKRSGETPNMIICSWGVRRAIQRMFTLGSRIVDTVELKGGYKAISYNGIPIVVDRHCPEGCLYLLNTDFFELHQLCDWQWLSDDDGKVLKQVPGKPTYMATLVKYAELMCSKPSAQGLMTGIVEG